jgi:hypothetical protein
MGRHENPSKSQVLIDHWQIQTIGAIPGATEKQLRGKPPNIGVSASRPTLLKNR